MTAIAAFRLSIVPAQRASLECPLSGNESGAAEARFGSSPVNL